MDILVTGDWHVPFHERGALAQMLTEAHKRRPDWIILNGDIIDFYSISFHLRDPRRLGTLQEDLNRTRELLTVVRDLFPRKRITYLAGNHEERLLRYLWSGHTELSCLDVLSLPQLLGLNGLKIELHPRPALFIGTGLVVTHGNLSRKRAGYAAHAMLDQFGCSGVSGHTHRLAQVYRRYPDGRVHQWVESGCMCQLQASYAPYPDWQHGYTWVEVSSDGMLVRMEHRIVRADASLELARSLPFADRPPMLEW